MTDSTPQEEKSEYETVTMYRCVWCGKLFKTDRLHRCKFAPKMRNCFSCAHCNGVDKTTLLPFYDDVKDVVLICGIAKLLKCANPVREMAEKHWKMDCPKWQQLEDYQGKDSYMHRIVWKMDQRKAEDIWMMAETPWME